MNENGRAPEAPTHKQQSMIIVPMNTPVTFQKFYFLQKFKNFYIEKGITIIRPMTVFGYDDSPHGHCEVYFILYLNFNQ